MLRQSLCTSDENLFVSGSNHLYHSLVSSVLPFQSFQKFNFPDFDHNSIEIVLTTFFLCIQNHVKRDSVKLGKENNQSEVNDR